VNDLNQTRSLKLRQTRSFQIDDNLPSQIGTFTLGECAFLCQISADRLRDYCMDTACPARARSGIRLQCYRIGRGTRPSRRVKRHDLIVWMNSMGIPLDVSQYGASRVTGAFPPDDWVKGNEH